MIFKPYTFFCVFCLFCFCFVFLCVFTNTLTYVNSVCSPLSDVTREDLDVIAVGLSDCRQVDAEAAVKLLVVCVHDGW